MVIMCPIIHNRGLFGPTNRIESLWSELRAFEPIYSYAIPDATVQLMPNFNFRRRNCRQ